jgi:hypothetical protein
VKFGWRMLKDAEGISLKTWLVTDCIWTLTHWLAEYACKCILLGIAQSMMTWFLTCVCVVCTLGHTLEWGHVLARHCNGKLWKSIEGKSTWWGWRMRETSCEDGTPVVAVAGEFLLQGDPGSVVLWLLWHFCVSVKVHRIGIALFFHSSIP